MSILSLIPITLVHIMVLAGILGIITGFVLSFIPLVEKYKLAIQVISILLLGFGAFLEGMLIENKEWNHKVKELELKLSKAEVQASKVNTEIITKVITKKQIIKVKADKIDQYIDREVKVYDKTCPIPEVLIKAHDASALSIGIEDVVLKVDSNAAKNLNLKLPKK